MSEREAKEAFEIYADQYDNFGDEWQDMGVDEHFIAGFKAGQARAQPEASAGQWIPCSERLPTEDDEDFQYTVWVLFADGSTELMEVEEVRSVWDDSDCPIVSWMPTGLRRPQRPQTQGEE